MKSNNFTKKERYNILYVLWRPIISIQLDRLNPVVRLRY